LFSSAENSFQESQLYLDAVIQNGREEIKSQSLVEMVDRSELAEPVILIADRGYEAYNNMAHIEQKGWNYLIRVKEKRGILSGLQLPDTPEFDAAFHLFFAEESPRLCHALFRVYVLVNPSLAFSLRDGFFWWIILMRLGLDGDIPLSPWDFRAWRRIYSPKTIGRNDHGSA
jgi:hypothetical protein